MTTIFKKFATGTATLALMTTVFATGAMAEEVGTSVQVNPGTLSLTGLVNATFAPMELSTLLNESYSSSQAMPFTITDTRGDDAGWHLQIAASQFTDTVSLDVLPADILSIDNTALISSQAVTLMDQTKMTLTGTSQTIVGANANDGSGMGSFDFTGANLVIDAASANFSQYKAGNYSSTVTLTLAATPQS